MALLARFTPSLAERPISRTFEISSADGRYFQNSESFGESRELTEAEARGMLQDAHRSGDRRWSLTIEGRAFLGLALE